MAISLSIAFCASLQARDFKSSSIRQRTDLYDIRSMEIEGNFKVFLSEGMQGNGENIRYETTDDVSKKINVSQKGRKLVIKAKGKGLETLAPVVIRVHARNLEQIRMDGTSVLQLDDPLSCKSVKIEMHGQSYMEGRIQALEGVDFQMDGNSRAKIEIQSLKTLHITLEESAKLGMDGYAVLLKARLSDASEMQAAGFSADKADFRMDGTASARIRANKLLQAKVSQSAELIYTGSAKTKIATSEAAKVIIK